MSHSTPSGPAMADLVIIIDTSPGMRDEAVALSAAADAAIQHTLADRPLDLRVVWLGLEGSWQQTRFQQTVRDYLMTQCQVPENALRSRKRGRLSGGSAQADGARAMEDLCRHFPWRAGARRALFYLANSGLDGGGEGTGPAAVQAADQAIRVARETAVRLHTYFGRGRGRQQQRDELHREFARVATETEGLPFIQEDVGTGWAAVLETVLGDTASSAEASITPPTAAGAAPTVVAASVETRAQPAPPADPSTDPSTELPIPSSGLPLAEATGAGSGAMDYARRTRQAADIIRQHALGATGVGLVPLPLLDLTAFFGLQLTMLKRLADHYGVAFSRNLGKSLVASLLGGVVPVNLALYLFSSAVKALPGAGTVVGVGSNALLGGAATYAIGRVFMMHFEAGGTFLNFDPAATRDHFRQEFEAGKRLLRQNHRAA